MCENKFYGNKMKLEWPNYLKQTIYWTERKFIKLREETKKHHTVSVNHDRDPIKDINYIFLLRTDFHEMH